MSIANIPKKYRPRGFDILHEDADVIVGNKAAGFLTVAALWEKEKTIHGILNTYVRKGSAHSRKCVHVVHRLDQATSGVLMFAKTPEAQLFLKANWKSTEKTYYAIVQGNLKQKSGLISSFLEEDEDYFVHSTQDPDKGKLAQTEYSVVKETPTNSLLKIKLITGKKNQIRVHVAELGHPILGDPKYGGKKNSNLMLHSFAIVFAHPFTRKRIRIQAEVPDYFKRLITYHY